MPQISYKPNSVTVTRHAVFMPKKETVAKMLCGSPSTVFSFADYFEALSFKTSADFFLAALFL